MYTAFTYLMLHHEVIHAVDMEGAQFERQTLHPLTPPPSSIEMRTQKSGRERLSDPGLYLFFFLFFFPLFFLLLFLPLSSLCPPSVLPLSSLCPPSVLPLFFSFLLFYSLFFSPPFFFPFFSSLFILFVFSPFFLRTELRAQSLTRASDSRL